MPRAPRRGRRTERRGDRVRASRWGAARLEINGVDPDRLRSLRRQRMALAAKVVAIYGRSVWEDVGANGLSEGEHCSDRPGRSVTVCCRHSSRPNGSATCSRSPSRPRRGGARRARADVRAARASRARSTSPLGNRSVHARLRDAVVARRRTSRRPASRHPRSALLRLRFRPVGGRLHGRRGRTGRAAAAAALGARAV